MDYKKDLATRLDDLRPLEGFPIGKDEDILALSDPPHFTACPNPYIAEFIEKHGKPYDEATYLYEFEMAAQRFPDPVQGVTAIGIGGFLVAEKLTPPVYNAFGA